MKSIKDLSEVDLNAAAGEIRGELASCMAQLDTAKDSVNQAEADRREARAEYSAALENGNKHTMDQALRKIAAAADILHSPPAGVEGILARIEEFQGRQQELIAEARRRKAGIEVKVSELTKQLPVAEGVVGGMSALAMEIGKLVEKIKKLLDKDDKKDKK